MKTLFSTGSDKDSYLEAGYLVVRATPSKSSIRGAFTYILEGAEGVLVHSTADDAYEAARIQAQRSENSAANFIILKTIGHVKNCPETITTKLKDLK